MAKRSEKRPAAKNSGATRSLAIRVTPEYAAWLDRAARSNGDTIAAFLARGAARLAKEVGFKEAPPERIP